MTVRLNRPLVWLVLALGAAPLSSQIADGARIDTAIAAALEGQWLVGGSVAQLTPEGELLHGFGSWSREDSRVPDGDTLFEIGSISKVFTGLLLADAVVRGELSLETTVAELLPDDIDLDVVGRPITLLDLSTHTSGLPRMPHNFAPADPARPFEDYDVALLLECMDEVAPQRAPEVSYEYSNLAVGLLGWLVAQNAESDYETLLTERVLEPLGMHDTALVLEPRLAARFAPPHNTDGEASAAWKLGSLKGAGGIRSSARDMLRFARFAVGELEPVGSETLTRALAVSMIPRRDVSGDGSMRIGLGWHINIDEDVWWHNGQTGGYHAMLQVIPDADVAVLGLSNTANGVIEQVVNGLMVEWLGGDSLNVQLPHFEQLEPGALKRLVGRYSHALLGTLDVTRTDDRLYAQLPNQPAFRIWPESKVWFSYRGVDARLLFLGHEGPASEVRLYQNGAEMPFERIADE
jgi:CubicO group peptidase (beta-lactamase class C family)